MGLGARVAGLYLLGAAAGVAAGAGTRGPPLTGVPATLQVLGLGLLITFVINCTSPPVPGSGTPGTPVPTMCDRAAGWVLAHAHVRGRPAIWPNALRGIVVVAGLGVLARLVASGPVLGWPAVHALAGWVLPAVGLGLALAAGPAWGAAGFAVLGVGFARMVPAEATAAVPGTLAAASVSVVVAAVINLAACRGFATTEAMVRSAEAADVARLHAEQRLLARRRRDRMLHDTLLSTLTLLAHGGAGVPADQVRRDCRRDLAALCGERWSVPEEPTSAGRGGRPDGVSPAERVPRQAAPLVERLEAVRELAARRGVDLRVHVQARGGVGVPGPARSCELDTAVPAAGVLEAWSGALAECVTNITLHAGVTAADVVLSRTDDVLVTLVVDEGAGFESATAQSERLGLSGSVRERVTDVGGRARVWSRPGQGTVVELVLPWPRCPPEALRTEALR